MATDAELREDVVDHVDAVEEPPRLRFTRRNVVLGVVFVAASLAFLYWGVPRLAGLEETWERIEHGDPWWLAVALGCTVASFLGYVALFHRVLGNAGSRVDLRASYQITMAGLAATRLFAAGGAGGVALMAWALRRAGMRPRDVAASMLTFLLLTYWVYAAAVIVVGVGLYTGLFPGAAPFAVTMVPAMIFGTLMLIFFSLATIPYDTVLRLRAWADRRGGLGRTWRRLVGAPAELSPSARRAARHLRPGDFGLWGSTAYWGFNIGVLYACFQAFGASPPVAVVVMGYFVGMLGNLLPLPGGVGGVDGGMIGAFAALGVDFGLATVAVLSYRGFAFWLPTIPGAIAYLQLRRTVSRWRDERAAVRRPAHYTL